MTGKSHINECALLNEKLKKTKSRKDAETKTGKNDKCDTNKTIKVELYMHTWERKTMQK